MTLWLPLLFVPHVVLTGVIIYKLTDDDPPVLECKKRRRRFRQSKRFRNSPMRRFAISNHMQIEDAQNNLWKRAMSKSLMHKLSENNRFYSQLFSAVLQRQIRKERQTESPMQTYILNSNVGIILAAHYVIRRSKIYSLNSINTEMKKEIVKCYKTISSYREYKELFKTQIMSRIQDQQKYVLSPLRKAVRATIWCAELSYERRFMRHHHMLASAMFQYVKNYDIRCKLESLCWLREYDSYHMSHSPIHTFTLQNKNTILSLSDKHAQRREIKSSPMNKCAKQILPLLEVLYHFNNNNRNAISTSPLRKYITSSINDCIRSNAQRAYKIRMRQKIVDELLDVQYTSVYNKMMLRRFRQENKIPEVTIKGVYNTVYVLFPRNTLKHHQFITDTQLQCFEAKEDYYGENDLQTYCITHISDEAQMNDLVDLSQTFKNLSSLTDEKAKVWLLTDSNKLTISGNALDAQYYIRISFVRRDREDFDIDQYKSCYTEMQEYSSNKNLSVNLLFENKWLSDELIIALEAPVTEDRTIIKNTVEDIVQRINMIKGLIFAKIVDQIRWIKL